MKVLIIGDSCQDVFVYGDCKRICPEAPVPVFNPVYTIKNDGMAGNVTKNLESLGANVELITNTSQMNKTRFVEKNSNQMLVRVDDTDVVEALREKDLEEINWDKYDAVIISDYDKGFLSPTIIRSIATKHPLTFLDTKKQLGDWAENVTFIKINSDEYEKTKHSLSMSMEDNLIVTMGGEGCRYKGEVYPTKKVEVQDVSGAGDTFLAGLVYTYLEGEVSPEGKGSIGLAIQTANMYASKVVQSRGVSIVTK